MSSGARELGGSGAIVASKIVNGAAVRTRPLCPYPKKAIYNGHGSTDDAANFVCR